MGHSFLRVFCDGLSTCVFVLWIRLSGVLGREGARRRRLRRQGAARRKGKDMVFDTMKYISRASIAFAGIALCATLAVFGTPPAALAEESAEGEATAEVGSTEADESDEAEESAETEESAEGETMVDLDYDLSSLDSILSSMEADYEDTVASLSEQYELVGETIGGTYEGYLAKGQALDDWYALVLSESQSFFDRLEAGCEEYLKLVASSAASEGGYYDYAYEAVGELDDLCYDIFDEYYDDVYDDLMDEASEDYCFGIAASWDESIDIDEWETVYDDCFDTWSDARSEVYRLMNVGEDAVERCIARADIAFSYENYDVESVLDREFLSSDLSSILDEIDADIDATVASLSEELSAVPSPASQSYEDYAATAEALSEWYEQAQSEIEALYDRIDGYAVDYYVALAAIASPEDPYTMDAAFQEIYWAAYSDVYTELYNKVYVDLFGSIDDDILYDSIYEWNAYYEDWYEQWEEEWEECYDEWDEACEAIYDLIWDQYDVFYDSYSEVRSAFLYDDDYDVGAILGIEVTVVTQAETEDAEAEEDEAVDEDETEDETEAEAEAETEVEAETELADSGESAGIGEDFQAAMESYEAFYDEYIEFMELSETSDDANAITQAYKDFWAQYEETMSALSVISDFEANDEEVACFIEVSERIFEKLEDAGYSDMADVVLESVDSDDGIKLSGALAQ